MNYISSETPHKKKKDETLAYVHKENHKVKICSLINDGYEKGFVARHGYKFYLLPGTEGAKSQMDDRLQFPPSTQHFKV